MAPSTTLFYRNKGKIQIESKTCPINRYTGTVSGLIKINGVICLVDDYISDEFVEVLKFSVLPHSSKLFQTGVKAVTKK